MLRILLIRIIYGFLISFFTSSFESFLISTSSSLSSYPSESQIVISKIPKNVACAAIGNPLHSFARTICITCLISVYGCLCFYVAANQAIIGILVINIIIIVLHKQKLVHKNVVMPCQSGGFRFGSVRFGFHVSNYVSSWASISILALGHRKPTEKQPKMADRNVCTIHASRFVGDFLFFFFLWILDFILRCFPPCTSPPLAKVNKMAVKSCVCTQWSFSFIFSFSQGGGVSLGELGGGQPVILASNTTNSWNLFSTN